MEQLRVHLFKSSHAPFIAMLNEGNIQYEEQRPPVGRIIMAGSTITVLSALSDASPWGALAIVLVTWINSKTKRSVIITTKDNEVINFHAQGYSPKEVESLLKKSKNISVVDSSN